VELLNAQHIILLAISCHADYHANGQGKLCVVQAFKKAGLDRTLQKHTDKHPNTEQF